MNSFTRVRLGDAFRGSLLVLIAVFGLWSFEACSKPEPVSGETERTDETSATSEQAAVTTQGSTPTKDIIGLVIHFGAGGGSERYRISGWSRSQDRFTWTEGRAAVLTLPIPADPGPLTFRLKAKGMTSPPEVPFQPVEVYADGRKVADWKVSAIRDYTAEIPAELTKNGGRLLIELRTPKAIPPKSAGQNDAPSAVALFCYEAELKRL